MAKEFKLLTQSRVFLEKLNRNQKWILGVVAAVVMGGIIALAVTLSSPTETAVLFNRLEPQDAAKITEYLTNNNIDYELRDNASTIVIPKNRVDDVRLEVAQQELIQDSYVGYELFDKTNLGMSEFVQQLNARRALEGELQRTIKSMDEVQDVKVLLVMPKKALFTKDEKPPTAAIKLRLKSGRSLSKISVEGIQSLVASSVEGLTPDKVTITDNNGRLLSAPPLDENSIVGKTSSQLDQQKNLEAYLSGKVQELLDPAFGPENTRVKVNAEIDFDQLEWQKRDYDPERQVERSEQNITDHFQNTDTTFVPTINELSEKTNEIKNYEVTQADTQFVKSLGNIRRLGDNAIKQLTVTAIVNDKIERRHILDEEGRPTGLDTVVATPRDSAEIENIKNAIKTAVGLIDNDGNVVQNQQVNVLSMPFADLLADEWMQVNEYNQTNNIKWYEKEDMQKLLLFLLVLLITALFMYKIIHAKFAKEKMRIAMGLPEKLEQPKLNKFDSSLIALPQEIDTYDDEDEDEDEEQEELILTDTTDEEMMYDIEEEGEEMELEDDDMMIMPDELPEQLLLDNELFDGIDAFSDLEEEIIDLEQQENNESSLMARAIEALRKPSDAIEEDTTEDELIKIELRDKVSAFFTDTPDQAVKLFRLFYNQDREKV